MTSSWITQGPLSVCETRLVIVSPLPPLKFRTAGFPQYGFKREVRRDLRQGDTPTYTRRQYVLGKPVVLADKHLAVLRLPLPTHSRPEALGSPTGCVVRSDHRLLWPHPSHSWPVHGLSSSPVDRCGDEWFPTLLCLSVRACHPQDPGEPDRCVRLLLPYPQWSSPNPSWLDIHSSTPLVLAWTRNEAGSGSFSLRPARLLALHQQGHLLPSFRRPGRPGPTSAITTQANSQFLRPDLRRQDKQHYGLRADNADERGFEKKKAKKSTAKR